MNKFLPPFTSIMSLSSLSHAIMAEALGTQTAKVLRDAITLYETAQTREAALASLQVITDIIKKDADKIDPLLAKISGPSLSGTKRFQTAERLVAEVVVVLKTQAEPHQQGGFQALALSQGSSVHQSRSSSPFRLQLASADGDQEARPEFDKILKEILSEIERKSIAEKKYREEPFASYDVYKRAANRLDSVLPKLLDSLDSSELLRVAEAMVEIELKGPSNMGNSPVIWDHIMQAMIRKDDPQAKKNLIQLALFVVSKLKNDEGAAYWFLIKCLLEQIAKYNYLARLDLLPVTLALEEVLKDPSPKARLGAIEALTSSYFDSLPYIDHDVSLQVRWESRLAMRKHSLVILNDSTKSIVEKEEALIRFAFSYRAPYSGGLSLGAVRHLILEGQSWLRGEMSAWNVEGEEMTATFRTLESLRLGDKLQSAALDSVNGEVLLSSKRLNWIQGKLKGLDIDGTLYGYFSGSPFAGLDKSQIDLLPVQDPFLLSKTIEELLKRIESSGPKSIELSMVEAGAWIWTRGRKFALLAQYALGSPQNSFSEDLREWETAAPGAGGWFYFPLKFNFPPKADYFSTEKDRQGEWGRNLAAFITVTAPNILHVDMQGRFIKVGVLQATRERKEKIAFWYPSRRDWEAIVTSSGSEKHPTPKINREEFQRRFFSAFWQEDVGIKIRRALAAGWMFDVLRSARDGDKSRGEVSRLGMLQEEFETEFAQLLKSRALGSILESAWWGENPGDTNASVIYKDMLVYQQALKKEPELKQTIVNLVEDTIAKADEILGIVR